MLRYLIVAAAIAASLASGASPVEAGAAPPRVGTMKKLVMLEFCHAHGLHSQNT